MVTMQRPVLRCESIEKQEHYRRPLWWTFQSGMLRKKSKGKSFGCLFSGAPHLRIVPESILVWEVPKMGITDGWDIKTL